MSVISTQATIVSAYPVGSIYMNASVSTNPGTLLGFGTWSALGAGRVLVGLNAGDPDFDTAGETGGAKTVTSTGTNSVPTFTGSALSTHDHGVGTFANTAISAGTPAGTNSAPTFTGSALSTHSHGVGSYVNTAITAGTPAGTNSAPTFTGNAVAAASTQATPDLVTSNVTGTGVAPVTTATGTVSAPTFTGSALATHNHTFSGSSEAVTAGTPAGTNSAPTFTGSALGTHNHTFSGTSAAVSAGTPAGTVSAPTFTGNATSVVQPYIVVYMWQRTA